MQFILSLLPDPDTITMLVEESMPWFMAWCFLLCVVLAVMVIGSVIGKVRQRSPVEKLVKRRGFGV